MHQASSQQPEKARFKISNYKTRDIATEMRNIEQRQWQSKSRTCEWYLKAENWKVHRTTLPRGDGQCSGCSVKPSLQHPCERHCNQISTLARWDLSRREHGLLNAASCPQNWQLSSWQAKKGQHLLCFSLPFLKRYYQVRTIRIMGRKDSNNQY